MNTKLLSLISTLTFASITASLGQPIALSNFSFESPSGSAPNGVLDPANGSIGGWQYSRTGLLAATLTDVTFGSWGTASEGSNAATLTFLLGVAAEVSLFQSTSDLFQPNTLYTLTFDAGQASLLSLLTGASASIYSNSTPVATLSGASLISLLDLSGQLSTFSLAFETGAVAPAGNIGLGFSAGGLAQVAGSGLVIDNVQMTAVPIPEPSSALLIGSTGLWLLFNRRRRF